VSAQTIHWEHLSPEEIVELLSGPIGGPEMSGFLDAHQWIQLVADGFNAWGGHADAQFRRVSRGPLAPESVALFGRHAAPASSQRVETQRIRGELRAIGLPPGSFGDLQTGAEIALASMPECRNNLLAAGWEEITVWPAMTTAPGRVTVPSLRLDAVVAGIFHVSRGEAQTALEYGFVSLNFALGPKRTVDCKAGDQIIFRGKGRAIVSTASAPTRSGRLWVEYQLCFA
jgi:hypothetical protein